MNDKKNCCHCEAGNLNPDFVLCGGTRRLHEQRVRLAETSSFPFHRHVNRLTGADAPPVHRPAKIMSSHYYISMVFIKSKPSVTLAATALSVWTPRVCEAQQFSEAAVTLWWRCVPGRTQFTRQNPSLSSQFAWRPTFCERTFLFNSFVICCDRVLLHTPEPCGTCFRAEVHLYVFNSIFCPTTNVMYLTFVTLCVICLFFSRVALSLPHE